MARIRTARGKSVSGFWKRQGRSLTFVAKKKRTAGSFYGRSRRSYRRY